MLTLVEQLLVLLEMITMVACATKLIRQRTLEPFKVLVDPNGKVLLDHTSTSSAVEKKFLHSDSADSNTSASTDDIRDMGYWDKEGQPLADRTNITKLQRKLFVNSSHTGELAPLTLPGRMRSANLFLFDLILVPQQNLLAIFSLCPKGNSTLQDLGSRAEKELTELHVRLAFYPKDHVLKCGILDSSAAMDYNACGASTIMLCHAPHVNISEHVRRAQEQHGTLAIQLGNELVNVSAATLSSGQTGFAISRTFKGPPSSLRSGRPLRVSAVIPWFGGVPPYLAETLQYHWKVGVSHVYMGLYQENVPGKMKSMVQKLSHPDFVSILEIDSWNAFDLHHAPSEQKMQGVVNDWALYHAKSWDDLLLTHDYDELVVPTQTQNLANALQTVLSVHGLSTVAVEDMCYLLMCPLVTFSQTSGANLTYHSRAEDYPLMDSGGTNPFEFKFHNILDSCTVGGFINIYPKSIVVVRNIFKALVHFPAACSAVSYKEQMRADATSIDRMMVIHRNESVVLQHFAGMFLPNRYTPSPNASRPTTSVFTKVWGTQLF